MEKEVPTKLLVCSKPPRFRRAGIEFTREKIEIETADLTDQQLEAIYNESMLVVEELAETLLPDDGGIPVHTHTHAHSTLEPTHGSPVDEGPTDKPSKKKPKG